MKLVLAQGNPGPDYAHTRHNVGFLALDFYARQHDLQFQPKPKFHADIAEATINGDKILFAKPTTFYNQTGQSARAIADFYKIPTHDILVIHDELALPFGTLRTRQKGSDAGNNGVKSLNAHLGQHYARIRVGTWSDLAARAGAHDFVLSKFTADETARLEQDIFPKTAQLIDDFAAGTHTSASHSL